MGRREEIPLGYQGKSQVVSSAFLPAQNRPDSYRLVQLKEAKTALDEAYRGKDTWPQNHGYKIGNQNVDLEPGALVVRDGAIWTKYTFSAEGQCSKVEKRDEISDSSSFQEVNGEQLDGLKKKGEQLLLKLPKEGKVVDNSGGLNRRIRL